MIGFDLTDAQKELQERSRRFSKERILPVAVMHDREGTFPQDVIPAHIDF
jgi:alkylation response protein AidB-like acyl-CoA dehydrogenase